jgi:hypothetical protein
MIRILITSVGSLVGQNILDSLETRRHLVRVTGLNSEAENQRIFRCDKAYLVPQVRQTEEFSVAFDRIFRDENPDLVFAGRDIDVLFLAKYKKEHPEIGNRIPCGDPCLAEMMLDKLGSCHFADRHGLPFAATFLFRNHNDRPSLNNFISEFGFPLVVKPRRGFASLGVYYLLNMQQLEPWLKKNNEILFQEFLGDKKIIEQFEGIGKSGIPLYFQVPEDCHYAAQVVLSPGGFPIRSIITKHTMFGGKAESLKIFISPEVDKLVSDAAGIIGAGGWSGFLNLQFKEDRFHTWKFYEFNPRMVGATSARLLMGFDEIGMLIENFFPGKNFPDLSLPEFRDGMVLKSLTDRYIDRANINQLLENGKWERPVQGDQNNFFV